MKSCTDLVLITSEYVVAAKPYEKTPIIKMSDRRFVYVMNKLSVPS